jgi:hypothetical protein
MLGTKEKIKWQQNDAGLIVTTPAMKISDLAIVFKMTTD